MNVFKKIRSAYKECETHKPWDKITADFDSVTHECSTTPKFISNQWIILTPLYFSLLINNQTKETSSEKEVTLKDDI